MEAVATPSFVSRRTGLLFFAFAIVFATFALAGPRAALLLMTGLGFGLTLEGLRFGFTGPWRQIVTDRDGRGLLAQLLAIGLTALVAFPLLNLHSAELNGAYAPIGIAMVVAAFIFGAAMQLVMGCGSGTLVNAGSGNLISLLALIGFIAGSFFGTLHLPWWASLGSLPVYTMQGLFGSLGGLVLSLLGLAGVAALVCWRALPGKRVPDRRLWWAAGLIALLAVLNLMIAGQSWGVVYGLGLWGAKVTQAVGVDLSSNVFWGAPAHAERLQQSILTDATSLTNLGLIAGAFIVMRWRSEPGGQVAALAPKSWAVILLAGVVLGYSARVAFGCNVGAYFSGISTGSLHGWAWFVAAFAGSIVGIRLRPALLIPAAGQGEKS
ncbi:MAG: YeeE/YedE family protein [Pseudomonadales bacterium]|nr:YeeE/YedE family protein [Pseudomonadales bacterium]